MPTQIECDTALSELAPFKSIAILFKFIIKGIRAKISPILVNYISSIY